MTMTDDNPATPGCAVPEHSHLDFHATLTALGLTADSVASLIGGVSPERLHAAEKPGKWSIVQVLRHLADSEIAGSWRLRLVLAEERPPLVPFDETRWCERLDYHLEPPYRALADFRDLRAANLRLLGRTTAADRLRTGIHIIHGTRTAEQIVAGWVDHDRVHVRQIERILASRGSN